VTTTTKVAMHVNVEMRDASNVLVSRNAYTSLFSIETWWIIVTYSWFYVLSFISVRLCDQS